MKSLIAISSSAPTSTGTTNSVSVHFDAATEKVIKEATDNAVETTLATIVGGLLATLGGIFASRHAHRLQVEQQDRQEGEFSKNVQGAIRRELEVLGNVYTSGIEPYVANLQPDTALTVRLSLSRR